MLDICHVPNNTAFFASIVSQFFTVEFFTIVINAMSIIEANVCVTLLPTEFKFKFSKYTFVPKIQLVFGLEKVYSPEIFLNIFLF